MRRPISLLTHNFHNCDKNVKTMNNQLNFGATSSLSQRQSSTAKLSLQNDVYKEKPYFSIFSFEPSHTSIGYEFHSFTFMHLKKSK